MRYEEWRLGWVEVESEEEVEDEEEIEVVVWRKTQALATSRKNGIYQRN